MYSQKNITNDNSFFTVILPWPSPIKFWDIYSWAEKDSITSFRFIRDLEISNKRLTLQDVDNLYPGVKTISVVSNPWARFYWTYVSIHNPPPGSPSIEKILSRYKHLAIDTFENFILSLENCEVLDNFKHPCFLQYDWISYSKREVDFLFKAETINKDFKILQNYFCTTQPLGIDDFTIDYRPYYNDSTKAVIERIFQRDIEKFNYSY